MAPLTQLNISRRRLNYSLNRYIINLLLLWVALVPRFFFFGFFTLKISHSVVGEEGKKMPTQKINPDLARERQKCTFDREELATYWIGDKQKLEEKRARGKLEIFGGFWVGIFMNTEIK